MEETFMNTYKGAKIYPTTAIANRRTNSEWSICKSHIIILNSFIVFICTTMTMMMIIMLMSREKTESSVDMVNGNSTKCLLLK